MRLTRLPSSPLVRKFAEHLYDQHEEDAAAHSRATLGTVCTFNCTIVCFSTNEMEEHLYTVHDISGKDAAANHCTSGVAWSVWAAGGDRGWGAGSGVLTEACILLL